MSSEGGAAARLSPTHSESVDLVALSSSSSSSSRTCTKTTNHEAPLFSLPDDPGSAYVLAQPVISKATLLSRGTKLGRRL
mmetsp:Transcript_1127/g.3611  ORF Transcript_1127/g.3611 Transcript_1127/m.3611 type:complete len:80 (+) Transcript_1127:494-733(+)